MFYNDNEIVGIRLIFNMGCGYRDKQRFVMTALQL